MSEDWEAWRQRRLGKLTSSRVYEAFRKKKDGSWYESRRKLMVELIGERLTGKAGDEDKFMSSEMLWGVETEPQARAAYTKRTGDDIEPSDFIDHPRIPMAGASPDGLVGDDGLVEIKCPTTRTHIATLIDRVPDEKHLAQIHWQLSVTGRKWCDLVSYDPRLPASVAMFKFRIERDEAIIKHFEKMAWLFLSEIDETIRALTEGRHLESQDIAHSL